MGLQSEGALDTSDTIIEALCFKFVEKFGVDNVNVRKEVVGQKGDNYVANMKRFVFQYKSREKPMQMIVKIAPTDEDMRNIMRVAQMFKNEALIYDKLLPKYKEFEDSADVPKEDRLRSAICFGVHLEAPNECIALEDLNESGFVLTNRLKSLTDEEVKIAFNDLAKFHALGFVLKERKSSTFKQMKTGLLNLWGSSAKDEMLKSLMAFIITQVELVLEEKDYVARVRDVLGSSAAIAQAAWDHDMSSEHAIVIHGDCWTNNFLFKSENGVPTEVVMVDYQLARVSSPVVDLHNLIFNSTDSEMRSKHYYEWLDYYYDNFTKHLSYHDLKSSQVYSRDVFDEDLRRYAKNSFVAAIFSASLQVREEDDIVDFKEEGVDATQMENEMEKLGVSNMKEATIKRFKDRVRGVVKDFILYGYI